MADELSPAERAKTQGFNDLLIGLVAAVGSLGSGLVFAAVGYGAMGLVGAAAGLIPLGLAFWWQMSRPAPVAAAPGAAPRRLKRWLSLLLAISTGQLQIGRVPLRSRRGTRFGLIEGTQL